MTLIRNIKGFTNKSGLRIVPVVVHFTSDSKGETLSLTAGNYQITVPYAEIEKIVKKERSFGYKKSHKIIDEGWGENG